jgi:UDP-3-O-[3-hydroxymyristoyl] glucosamine N-acyltransferase
MGLTLRQLATQLDAVLEGSADATVARVAPLAEAGADALSWLGGEKYLPELQRTRAAAVLVPPGVPVPPGVAALRVKDPDVALCTALRLLTPPPPTVPPGIDARAIVAPDARVEGACIAANVFVGPRATIGAGTQLHPGVYVGADTTIGRDCVLWPGVVVRERVTLGERVIVHPNATIGADGFGYLQRDGHHVKIPQVGTVVIEDDVEIGANTAVDRARSGVTRIGRGTKIDNLVQIAHNVDIGEDCIIAGQCGISGSCTLEPHVVLAGQVGVVDHLRIGARSHIGAQAGVIRDVPADTQQFGTPAFELRERMRHVAAVRRLPELQALVRELKRRIEELESAANDHT